MTYNLVSIKGVGPKMLKKLHNNDIYTPYQLLMKIPKTYGEYVLKNELTPQDHNSKVTIKVKIATKPLLNKFSKVPLVTFDFLTNYHQMQAIAFNQSYLVNTILEGESYIISGKYNFAKNQIIVSKITNLENYQTIEPKYNLNGISDHVFNKLVNEVLANNKLSIYENLPNYLLKKYGLVKREELYRILHNPKSNQQLRQGIKRLKYEEAYLFNKNFTSRVNKSEYRKPIDYKLDLVKELIKEIPYELTNDQKFVVNEIFKDYKKSYNTFRLIQGDVGSGKTVVSLIAILGMITAGKQVAFMAPTELLAKQQYMYFKKYLKKYQVELLTGSSKNKEKIKSDLESGLINLIVGTHALASNDVNYRDLGLIIIDEQHKFGVNIRKNLTSKGNASLIYLTATPIPRTLAITLFGDALISVIKEKPANRIPIETIYVQDNQIADVIEEIKVTISRNEKVYIVVPAIDSNHTDYNIIRMMEILTDYDLKKETIVLHGKLKDEAKEEAIESFLNSNKKVLLSTSMVEVGLDVKEATLMVIMNAEYFGLSQLHQLRGRVGRSNLSSKTILVGTKESKERLEILTKTNDGFILSEFDLKDRGPGSLIGLEQSGNISFTYLDFIKDFKIIKAMHHEVNMEK